MSESDTPPAAAPEGASRAWTWNFNHATAFVLILLAVALLAAVPYQVAEPQRLFGRALTALDPALYPRLVFGILLAVAIGYLVVSARLREPNLFRTVDGRGYFNVGVTLACLLAYAFALPRLGFVVSGMAVTLVLTIFYGNRNHLLTAAVGVLAPLAIYYGATRLLGVSLPELPFL